MRYIEGNKSVALLEHPSVNVAIIRNGAPEPSFIFIGKAKIIRSFLSLYFFIASRLTFSNAGMLCVKRMTWL